MVRVTSVLVAAAWLVGCSALPPDIPAAEMARLSHPEPELQLRVEHLLPVLAAENSAREGRALVEGRALDPREQEIARRVGVQNPQKVRVLTVPRMAPIADPELARLMPVQLAWGLTTGYGVTVTKAPVPDWLLAHELVHVAQFERAGLPAMLRRELIETLVLPRTLIPIEREAMAVGSRVAPAPPHSF